MDIRLPDRRNSSAAMTYHQGKWENGKRHNRVYLAQGNEEISPFSFHLVNRTKNKRVTEPIEHFGEGIVKQLLSSP